LVSVLFFSIKNIYISDKKNIEVREWGTKIIDQTQHITTKSNKTNKKHVYFVINWPNLSYMVLRGFNCINFGVLNILNIVFIRL